MRQRRHGTAHGQALETIAAAAGKELKIIGEQYPFEPLQYLRKTLKLTFAEGIKMLQDADYDVRPYGSLACP